MKLRDRLSMLACYAITFVVLPALPFVAAFARGWRP